MAQTFAQLVKGISAVSAPANSLNIDSSGRVGIGTASPTLKLSVDGDTWFGNGAGVEIGRLFNDAGVLHLRASSNVTGLALGTNGAEKARIDSSGRLLVGTSSTISSVTSCIENARSGGGFIAFANSNTVSATVALLGHIGFYGNNSGYGLGATVYAESDGTWSSASDCPGRLIFGTTADGASAPTERVRITSNGYLKASNTGSYYSATSAFHEVISSLNAATLIVQNSSASLTNSVNGVYVYYSGATPNNTNASAFYFEDTGGIRASIRSNGGLANYQANNVNFSDRSAKKNITVADDTWGCVKQWEIVKYHYKDQLDDADLNMGVIAQQVAESCPEVITVFQEAKEATEDAPAQEERLGVKEQQMMWMAIKALQEAQLRIETLEAEVTALKGL